MIVRRIEAHAAGHLAAVHRASFAAAWDAAEIAALIDEAGAFALAIGEGVPVGFLIARRAADEAEILTLAVDPAARRAGHGAALVEAAATEAAAAGAAALFLEVATDNVAALALYARCGFAQAGRRRGYYGRGDGARVDALVLRRRLRRDLTG